MQQVEYGQCGSCTHFGENQQDPQIFQIRTKHKAREDFVSDCGHPQHEPLDLKVTPISACAGFEPADGIQAD